MRKLLRLVFFLGLIVLLAAAVHEGLRIAAQGEGGMAQQAASTCGACHGG